MDNKIAELINTGWDVKFSNQVKRIDSEFVIRTCWKAEYGDERYESQWAGFKDAKSCIKDFIKNAEIANVDNKRSLEFKRNLKLKNYEKR